MDAESSYTRLFTLLSPFASVISRSVLHGYLTALALGADDADERRWLERIGIVSLPEDATVEAGYLLVEVIDEILDHLDADQFVPEADYVVVDGVLLPDHDRWAQGFLKGMRLEESLWEQRSRHNPKIHQHLLQLCLIAEPRRYAHLVYTEELDVEDAAIIADLRAGVAGAASGIAQEIFAEEADRQSALEPLSRPVVTEGDHAGPLSVIDLMDRITTLGDAVDRHLFESCVGYGRAMVPWLAEYLAESDNWQDDTTEEVWWGLLHCILILGAVDDESAVAPLLRALERMDEIPDQDLWDWLGGAWPALFRNKQASALDSLKSMAEDTTRAWNSRLESLECVLALAFQSGDEARLEQTLDWIGGVVSDPRDDPEFRFQAAQCLLDFPRDRFLDLLRDLANTQTLFFSDEAWFSLADLEEAWGNGDNQQWQEAVDPWRIYDESTSLPAAEPGPRVDDSSVTLH